jgi:hypothetical protein
MRGAGGGEVRRPLRCSKLPAGADIPLAFTLIPNVSQSLFFSGANQVLDELNRTHTIELKRECNTKSLLVPRKTACRFQYIA